MWESKIGCEKGFNHLIYTLPTPHPHTHTFSLCLFSSLSLSLLLLLHLIILPPLYLIHLLKYYSPFDYEGNVFKGQVIFNLLTWHYTATIHTTQVHQLHTDFIDSIGNGFKFATCRSKVQVPAFLLTRSKQKWPRSIIGFPLLLYPASMICKHPRHRIERFDVHLAKLGRKLQQWN